MSHYFFDFNTVSTGATPPKNEDSYAISDSLIIVADGATGLHPDIFVMKGRRSAPKTDAEWFAGDFVLRMESAMERMLRQRDEMDACSTASEQQNLLVDPQEALISTLDAMEEDYCRGIAEQKLEKDIRAAGVSCLPSTAFTMAYLDGGSLILCGLGDCPAIVKMRDGSVRVFEGDESLHDLDAKTKAFFAEYAHEHNMTIVETRNTEDAQEVLCEARSHMNSDAAGGYSIASFYNKDNIKMWQATLDADEVYGVLVMSDGFYQMVDTFCAMDAAALFDTCRDGSPMMMERELRKRQRDDEDCLAFVRLKIGDDATAVYARVR